MKINKPLGLIILSAWTTSTLIAGCNNDVGSEDNNLQTTQVQNASESHNLGCYDSFNETCGDSEIHLDGSTNEMHQKFKINPMYGNYMGDNIPMLISFKYNNRDWSMQHYHLGGNRNFDYNILESSLVFTDVNAESGCLSKPLIKQGETCYMYATAHLKIANENIKPDYNNFGARYYNLYDDKDTGLGYMTVNMSTVQTVQSIREIMPFELQYYTEAIKNNMNQYQIIRLQNISYSESRILTIQPNGIKLRNSEDKTFALVTRTSAIDDEFYGTHTQCATPETAEPSNNQVSSLKRGEECLLIYKAADKSDKAGTITNILDLKTNATASPNMNPEMNGRGYTDPITPEFKLAAIYKPDGESKFDDIDWKQSDIDVSLTSIRYENGIWVAASGNRGLKWSTDGKTWNNSNIINYFWGKSYYANGVWVVGSNIAGGGIGLKWSTDGKTWNSSNISNDNWEEVLYANGIWVTLGYGNGIKWSLDGRTWNNSNMNGNWNTLYFANGVWVAGVDSDGLGLKWSIDGKTWNNSNITTNTWSSVYYANGIWVAISRLNGGIKWSIDGKVWNDSNKINYAGYSVYNANGVWISGSYSSGLIWSVDGKIWNNSNISNYGWAPPHSNNKIWVTGSFNNAGLKLSMDGKTWTDSNFIPYSSWSTIYYANGIWIISGNSGTYYGIEHYSQPSGSLDNFVITH